MQGYEEHELVVLRADHPEHGLQKGDVGTIVGIYPRGGFVVEFSGADGETLAVVTLAAADIRPRARREVLHVREIDPPRVPVG
jgi:hypothetical protein